MDSASTDSKHIGFHFFWPYFIPLLVLLFSGLVLSIKKKLSHPHYHHHTHCFLQTKFLFCVFHIINNGQSTFFRCLQCLSVGRQKKPFNKWIPRKKWRLNCHLILILAQKLCVCVIQLINETCWIFHCTIWWFVCVCVQTFFVCFFSEKHKKPAWHESWNL